MDYHAALAEMERLRAGPRPLPVQVGMALMDHWRDPGARGGDIDSDLAAMISGIRKYQEYPYRQPPASLPAIWAEGATRLLACPAAAGASPRGALLLVPSLINRFPILDLMPEKSFARWLAGRGCDVYILDWGAPAADDPDCDAADIVARRLGRAVDIVRERQAGQPVDALGYCMGGTLLAGCAALRPHDFGRLVFLASPWDFHAGDRALCDRIRAGTPAALQMIEAAGVLPVDWIQSVFAAVNADRVIDKFSDFSRLDPDSPQARLFVAVEDWLNDGVDLPGPMARACLLDWYGENRPARGGWSLDGQAVRPETIAGPCLVVASARDRLVPAESALALARRLRDAAVLHPETGHIGMMTGRNAETAVWRPVLDWLAPDALKY